MGGLDDGCAAAGSDAYCTCKRSDPCQVCGISVWPRRGRDRFLRTGALRFGSSPERTGVVRRIGTRLRSTIFLKF